MMRLDLYLVSAGLADSRTRAKHLIESGAVWVDGKKADKCSLLIDEAASPYVEVTKTEKYVSRGGQKLEKALACFGIDVTGLCALDIGASTGGFTDCLLQHGAVKVYAVDSGEGQLAPSIASDHRVVNLEKYNARQLDKEDFETAIDIAVMDVSFISQTLILERIASVLPVGGILISLIKPQFEAGRAAVGKNGIVKNKKDRRAALIRVVECASLYGLHCFDADISPIFGGDGNVEFIAAFQKDGERRIDPVRLAALADKEPERRNVE